MKKPVLAYAILSSFVALPMVADANNVLVIDESCTTDRVNYHKVLENTSEVYDSAKIDVHPYVAQSQFTVDVYKGASLTVKGDTSFYSFSDEIKKRWDEGNYAFRTLESATLELSGNVNAVIEQSPNIDLETIGVNMLYASGSNSKMLIGQAGTQTKLWALGSQPDLISAKKGASVVINSTNNQLVGSIDMRSGWATKASSVEVTLSGENSYWFGDELTRANSVRNSGELGQDWLKKAGNEVYRDVFDITVENGATYSYFGLPSDRNNEFYAIPKRLSEITLQNGGIIDLSEENIRRKMIEVGLDKILDEGKYNVDHNYIRIGDLKGNGGIFRLDLNIDDKSKSDIVYIESSSKPGVHYIEPYNIENLEKITPDNTLRFATVAKDANVTFVDKVNLYDQTLYDYELYISSEDFDPNDPRNKDYNDRIDKIIASDGTTQFEKDPTFNEADFEGGTNWIIDRIVKKESRTVFSASLAGESSWTFATYMDRLSKRVGETAYQDGQSGLWARGRYQRTGNSDFDMKWGGVQIGMDYQLTTNNRIGVAVEYTNGNADFRPVWGKNELHGYGAMVYNTWYTDSGFYADLTARYGKFENEIQARTARHSIDASYRQSTAGMGLEVGQTFSIGNKGYFIEPQAQIQWTRVGGADWETPYGVKVKVNDAASYVGRLGVQMGKEWINANHQRNRISIWADALNDFSDGQDARLSSGDNVVIKTWGDEQTWYDAGISAQVALTKKGYLHIDFEKQFGGALHKSWQVNGNVRWTFD